ncbi:MAG: DNA cytosine methyltransferase [Erysipelotrichaceae bacterium]|nr:DNA cytosine methyltransferase [Erysipelotrichaceae bacterium]
MYNIIDLFSGVGGLTFGFEYEIKANSFCKRKIFKSVLAIDNDKDAVKAFSENFPKIPVLNKDIRLVEFEDFEKMNVDVTCIDAIIGGPPCQSFSTIGRRRNDDRAKLYEQYIRLISVLKPKIFLFENVKGLLSMKSESNDLVVNRIKSEFLKNGYNIKWKVLNAASFGVPQIRERVFIVGVRKDINTEFQFPKEKLVFKDYVNLSDAILDLPVLGNGQSSITYIGPPLSEYAKLMRNNSKELRNHTNGAKSELIMRIIENLDEGESKKELNCKVIEGRISPELFRKSGYDNTYGRLWWNRPGMTITNKINCPSSLRCIHPSQNRALTPREGARIQSFPDWYRFHGSNYSVMSQIGNAVPPLLSIYLADMIADFLERMSINESN